MIIFASGSKFGPGTPGTSQSMASNIQKSQNYCFTGFTNKFSQTLKWNRSGTSTIYNCSYTWNNLELFLKRWVKNKISFWKFKSQKKSCQLDDRIGCAWLFFYIQFYWFYIPQLAKNGKMVHKCLEKRGKRPKGCNSIIKH